MNEYTENYMKHIVLTISALIDYHSKFLDFHFDKSFNSNGKI